jgi:hypothetical protein
MTKDDAQDGNQGPAPGSNGNNPPSERTRFLMRLLDDQERDRLEPVERYLAEFASIPDFVRSEHANLVRDSLGSTAGGTHAMVPGRIGRYELLRVIGEGGMGRAWLARDPQVGREVVVKALRGSEGPNDPGHERLRREARVLGRLDHKALAEVLDILDVDDGVYLVLPFYEGRTLGAHIGALRAQSERGGVPRSPWVLYDEETPADRAKALRRLLTFFAEMADGLHTAHVAGIVHRDLKPHNVIVQPDGSPIVLDFGLALPIDDERLTLPGEVLGTPMYMSPEQIDGSRPVDARSDVYALGVLMYEALTLVHPFAGAPGREATFHRVLRGDAVPPRRHQPLIPRDLDAVVQKAMDRDPARRYTDAAAVARELRRVIELEPTEARPISGITRWMRKVVHRRRMFSMAAGMVLVLVGALWWQDSLAESRRDEERARRLRVFADQEKILDWRTDPDVLPSVRNVLDARDALDPLVREDLDPILLARLDDIVDLVLSHPTRAGAAPFLDCKASLYLELGFERVAEVTVDYDRLVDSWPAAERASPRFVWTCWHAANHALETAQDPKAGIAFVDRGLEALAAMPEWTEEARSDLVSSAEFFVTQTKRPSAGSFADTQAEGLLLRAGCIVARDGVLADVRALDEAIAMLRNVDNVHRLANALALRARLRLLRREPGDAAVDVAEARDLYQVGFTNLRPGTEGDQEPDKAGVASMRMMEAWISMQRGQIAEALAELMSLIEEMRGGDGLTRMNPVLSDVPLLAAKCLLDVGGDAAQLAVMCDHLHAAKVFYEFRGMTERLKQADNSIKELRE